MLPTSFESMPAGGSRSTRNAAFERTMPLTNPGKSGDGDGETGRLHCAPGSEAGVQRSELKSGLFGCSRSKKIVLSSAFRYMSRKPWSPQRLKKLARWYGRSASVLQSEMTYMGNAARVRMSTDAYCHQA